MVDAQKRTISWLIHSQDDKAMLCKVQQAGIHQSFPEDSWNPPTVFQAIVEYYFGRVK